MQRLSDFLPYIIIAAIFFLFLLIFHPQVFQYKIPSTLVHDYLRSQDIEDPQGLIHDRIFVSDSDIYTASGYLYVTGSDPVSYNFQHPPLVKYLFGFSTLLTDNPFWIQMGFGLVLLWLTYFLGIKLFKNPAIGYLGSLGILIDPVFGGMMNQTLLDLGQAVFALGYFILVFFFPESWIFQGIILGLFAASKFWSTAIIFVVLVWGFRILIKKEKLNFKKVLESFFLAFIVFLLTYTKTFIDSKGFFNIFVFLAKDLRFMISHNSTNVIGGPLILFATGYFVPWWTSGVSRASDWSFLWPAGLIIGVVGGVREFWEKTKNYKLFIYLLPFTYLLLESTQVPFTRYFIIILPFVYLGLAGFLYGFFDSLHGKK